MNQEDKIEPADVGDADHDAEYDAGPPGHGESEMISKPRTDPEPGEDVLPGSADELAQDSHDDTRQDTELPSIDNLPNAENAESSEHVDADDTDRIRVIPKMPVADRELGRDRTDHEHSAPKDYDAAAPEPAYSAAMDEGYESPDESTEATPDSVPEPAGFDPDETDLLEIVRRQWWLIGAIILAAMLAGAAILSQLTPLYTASAEVIIEPQRPTLPALEAILPGVGTDEQSIVTEAAVLTSGVLLDSVIDRLDLVSDPEFNSALGTPGGIRALFSRDEGARQVSAERMRALTRNTLRSRLEVTQVGDTRVISISATSESGDRSALIANTLVDEYLQSRRNARFQASTETSSWLEERIAELQAELQESEERAGRFRSDAELLEAGGTTLISQQLVDLNRQIISARAATAAARAELSQVSALIRSSDSSSILSSAGVLQSPLVQELRKQQVALERQIAELSSEFGPAHPRMVQLNADAADLQNQISVEVDKVVQGLRNAVQVAQAREAELERQAANMTVRMSRTKEDEIQLRAMERESEANRQLLETLLARRKELGSPDQAESRQPGARVISFAAAPITPSFPQIGLSMAGIFMVATIFGLVVAFVREIGRKGVFTLEQLETVTKLSALGFVPQVTSRRQRRDMLGSIVSNARLPFAQAMKTLNWQLAESMPAPSKVIVVTSSVPGEGKTTTAIGIARIKALQGHKTIIVDADIRNPTVHTRLSCKQESGLRDVIEGKSTLADETAFDELSALAILPAGQASSDALTLVESPEMSSVIKVLSDQYDYVIVDSPPIATAPDACVLSRQADTTIFVVRWSTTPVNAVRYALRVIKRNGGHMTGTILTMVEASRTLNRNYGYFGYYGYYGQKAT